MSNRCPYDKDGFCEKHGWCNDRCMDNLREDKESKAEKEFNILSGLQSCYEGLIK